MANKKVSQLTSKPAVNLTDLFLIADPTSGQAFKTTISDLGTAIGSGVSSVNTLVGAVVLDTDDIQELASPTNRWFTDTRARASVSALSPLEYTSGTGVFYMPPARSTQDGFLSSTDWVTFNSKQAALSGTGFVKISGTTISYDNSTYLTTSSAASTYLALAGGTLTGALNGTSATFTGDLTLSATNPRLYFTDTDNNPDYFISNTDGTFTIYDVTNSTSRFTIGTTGNGTFGGNLTVGQIIRSGGTSSQFLKADGSVDSSTYALDSAVVKLAGTQTITGDKAFTAAPTFDSGAGFKNPSGLYNYISATDTGWKMPVNFNKEHIFVLNTSTAYTYTFPNATGTLALTSDLTPYALDSAVVKLLTNQTITGIKTFLSNPVLPSAGSIAGQILFVDASNTIQTVTNFKYNDSTGVLTTQIGPLGSNAYTSTAYLPLSGGTLTGALSGTTANFTGGFIRTTGNGSYLRAHNYTWVGGSGGDYGSVGYNQGYTGTTTSYTYVLSDFASMLRFDSGGFNFLAAPSGTAGNAISFTPIVRFLNNGNVGINTTNPLGKFSVKLATATAVSTIANSTGWDSTYAVFGNPDAVSGQGFAIGVTNTLNGVNLVSLNPTADWINTNYYSLNHIFYGGGTERVRITNLGNVGIGTTSPSYKLQVNGASGTIARITDGTNNLDFYAGSSLNEISATTTLLLSTANTERMRITSSGNVGIGRTSPNMRLEVINDGAAQGTTLFATDNAVNNSLLVYAVSQDLFNTAGTAMILGRNSSTTRSINAGGTINSLGTDYAEYMTKSISESILKGDIVGIDKNGLLTNIFLDSNSFVIKSTNPSFVGGDAWASVDDIGKINNDSTEEEKQIHNAKIEKARAKVDRIAFSGQVPCNVLNAKVGDYIIPINDNGKIKGIAVSNPSFEQYQISVGKVWKIMEDGRAWVAVKIG